MVVAELATHLVPSQKLPELMDKLIALDGQLAQDADIKRAISSLQV